MFHWMRRNAGLFVLAMMVTTVAFAGKPNFGAALYGDGEVWGTKGNATLPPPNAHNAQSFDKLFMVVNTNNPNPDMQLPVSEAAPGNPAYNGGRWATYLVMWTEAGFNALGTVPILMSYDEIQMNEMLGYLVIAPGSMDGPQQFFQCPMLPFKGQ